MHGEKLIPKLYLPQGVAKGWHHHAVGDSFLQQRWGSWSEMIYGATHKSTILEENQLEAATDFKNDP